MVASETPKPHDFTAAPGAETGLTGVWATALATAIVLVFLAGLLWIVTVNAFAWFWPANLWELELADGTTVIGEIVEREPEPSTATADNQPTYRLKLKVGNRDLTGRDFLWVSENEVRARTRSRDLVRIIRTEYGDAFGRIVGARYADGGRVSLGDENEFAAFLDSGRELRSQQDRLEKDLERVRKPLTELEERLDILERSARGADPDSLTELNELEAENDRMAADLGPRFDELRQELNRVQTALSEASIELESGGSRLTVPLANLIRISWSNRLSFSARCIWAVREGLLFLFTEPREANTEGGIFPALFGTVLMVLLMSVAVVPLGVVTAVYMTEYARDGILLRLANQAVNNLAGVPSIVFGMFGLAFFIYGVGGTLDRFFYSDRLPTATFGTGGILWASLTLALMTVPVVVVATREGLLAVPHSWREGSLALGATQWQTLRRIVLPAAMPGILTGLILAISRAAGEVAPLMLTGAVKLAPSLPVDGSAPFLHLKRKFMHLGFHIYDVSMQSPNVEAAKPMAFATTLVLLGLVVLMNLTAIVVRRRLRRAYRGQAV